MKTLTINDLRSAPATQSVWVLNNTAHCALMMRNKDPESGKFKQERGDVVLTINSSIVQGEHETVVIPQSFLPIDMTEYASITDILNCRQFLRAVRDKLILIIDDETAEELFNSEGADLERKRMLENARRIREIGSARGITNTEVINVSNPSDNETPIGKKAEVIAVRPEPETEESKFDATFIANVIRWTQMEDIEVLNDMRSSGRFSRKELKYVLAHLDAHKYPSTIARIKKVLSTNK